MDVILSFNPFKEKAEYDRLHTGKTVAQIQELEK